MAKKIHDEQLKLDIIINGNDAQAKLGKLQQQQRELKQNTDALRVAKAKLEAQGKKDTEEYRNLTAELKKQNAVLKQNKVKQQELREEIGIGSLTTKQLRSEQKRLKSLMDNFTPDTDEWRAYAQQLALVDNRLSEVRNELNETRNVINDGDGFTKAQETFSNLLNGLKTGDLMAVKKGLLGVVSAVKTATKSAIAFIATPLGATLAVLAATIGAGKMWFDYNVAIAKTIKLTEQLTNLQGQELSDYRAQVQGLADTFDQEYNEVLRASNSLAKQMKISQTEALSLVEQGFVRGADAQGNFLSNLEQYPIQFKNAGYSAQEFIDVATQEAKGGVYDDKLLDTIKELDLALTEMTKTQKDALTNAFGQKFTTEISKGLDSGEIKTKEALNRIIAKSSEFGLSVQKQQQLLADLFKGAGEDAGGFSEIILQMNEAFKEENKQLSENELATQRLAKANQEQEKALADLFDASKSGFPAMLTNIKSIGIEIFTNTLKGFHNMFTSIEKLEQQAGLEGQGNAIKEISENMKLFGTTAKEEVETQLSAAQKNIARIKTQLEDQSFLSGVFGGTTAYKENLAKAEAYYQELLEIKNGSSTKFDEYQNDYIKEEEVLISTPKNEDEENDNELTSEDKKKIASKKKLAEFLKQWNEEQEIIEELRKFEKDAKAEEEDIIRLELKYEKMILEADGDLNLITDLEIAKGQSIQDIRDKWDKIRLDKKKETDAKFAKADKLSKENLVKAQEYLEKSKLKAMNVGVDLLGNILGKKSVIYKTMFALEKALAISEILTTTSKSIASAKAQDAAVPAVLPPGVPNPMKAVSIATMSANVLGAKISAASEIASIVGATVQGFEDGLYPVKRNDGKTFNAKLGKTTTGLVTQPTLMDGKYLAGERSTTRNPEMIIDDKVFSKLDPRIPQYITDVKHGRASSTFTGYEDGLYKEDNSRQIQETNETDSDNTQSLELLKAVTTLNSILGAGIKAKLILGYPEAEGIRDLLDEIDQSTNNGIINP